MEQSKLQALHDTLAKLRGGHHQGLGTISTSGGGSVYSWQKNGKHQEQEAKKAENLRRKHGLPDNKLYAYFIPEGFYDPNQPTTHGDGRFIKRDFCNLQNDGDENNNRDDHTSESETSSQRRQRRKAEKKQAKIMAKLEAKRLKKIEEKKRLKKEAKAARMILASSLSGVIPANSSILPLHNELNNPVRDATAKTKDKKKHKKQKSEKSERATPSSDSKNDSEDCTPASETKESKKRKRQKSEIAQSTGESTASVKESESSIKTTKKKAKKHKGD